MYRDKLTCLVAPMALGALLVSAACSSDGELSRAPSGGADAGPVGPTGPTGPTGPSGPGGSDGGLAVSRKANLRFKRHARLRNDVARALDLSPEEICAELGLYDCTEVVHTVALGGVAPYARGLFEPVEETTLTAPIAVERTVLAACTRRVDVDATRPDDQRIFRDVVVTEGRLADVDAPATADAIDRLYRRAVLRRATPSEVAHLRQLYRDIEADGGPGAARDWGILACFSILTSVEALFY